MISPWDKVLGTAEEMRQNSLIQRTHDLIRQYYERHGVRLTKNYSMIPELGISGIGLQHRLEKLGTTLAVEVDKFLGDDTIPEFPISMVRRVIGQYMAKGIRLTKKVGRIPELGGITGAALNERLRKKYQKTLAQVVRNYGAVETIADDIKKSVANGSRRSTLSCRRSRSLKKDAGSRF